jgi:magnesium transporter
MAVEEIKTKDYFKVIWKEFRVSLLVGLVLSIANGIRIVIQYNDITLAIVIGVTLLTTVVLAKALRMFASNSCKKIKTRPSNNGRTINYNNSRYPFGSYLF